MRMLSIVAVVAGLALLVAGWTVPRCRNYAGTARDSGYPCKVDRSSGATKFVCNRTSSVQVPFATVLAIGLIVVGGVGVAKTRR